MSALGNGVVPYTAAGPGFVLNSPLPLGTGGVTSTYETNQMDYVNSHPIRAVTTGGKRRHKSRRSSNKKKSKHSRRKCSSRPIKKSYRK